MLASAYYNFSPLLPGRRGRRSPRAGRFYPHGRRPRRVARPDATHPPARPEKKDDFEINEQGLIRAQLDPIKNGIALAGLFITSLALFVGAIGIMNITYVSVKERTKEIGTRKALGARRRTILLQFLIEAVAICFVGGVAGLGTAAGLSFIVGAVAPSFPLVFCVRSRDDRPHHFRAHRHLQRLRSRLAGQQTRSCGRPPLRMNFSETLRLALTSLAANKLRSGLTMLGIAVGVFSRHRRDDRDLRSPLEYRVGLERARREQFSVHQNTPRSTLAIRASVSPTAATSPIRRPPASRNSCARPPK